MEWMILPLKRYAQFSGRSRRMEFWMWILFVLIVAVILSIVDRVLGLGGTGPTGTSEFGGGMMAASAGLHGGILTMIFSLAIIVPNLAVSVRRLHDTNRSGWWIVLPMAPYVLGAVFLFASIATGGGVMMLIGGLLMTIGFICAIMLLVWYCLRGTAGPNRFGPDPLDPDGAADLGDVFS